MWPTVDNELLAPIITGVIIGSLTLAGVIVTARNKRRETNEAVRDGRAPDVDASWTKAEKAIADMEQARLLMYFWRDAYFELHWVFSRLFRRITGRHPDFEILEVEREALEEKSPNTRPEV